MAALTKEEFYNKQYAPGHDWSQWFPTGFQHFNSLNPPSDYKSFLDGKGSYNGRWNSGPRTYGNTAIDKNAMLRDFDNKYSEYKETVAAAEQKETLAQIQSRENTYNSLAAQIQGLTSGGMQNQGAGLNQALSQLSANRNYGASDLSTKLNFQVSDDQILGDYNTTRLGTLRSIADRGNTQIAGITERLNTAQTLLNQLPAGDPRRTSSDVYVEGLKKDLASVQGAVVDANSKIQDFKPLTVGSPEAASQITSFREYLQLPEERATQQLKQIDPESYQTAVGLGQKYREMATAPIGETRSAQTEQLRSNLEQEAINQLALGSQLGAEEQRQYQQAARGAQSARGNIFGIGPAVEEAVTTGLAGEQRKLARYGAANQFLASGQSTSDALRADLAFRDTLQQNRLGAASNFIAGGPSLYNLANQRTGQQQSAMQQYIQANQALPGQFGQAQSTASPFYQTVDQGIPVSLQNAFANLYGSQANYLSSTYGAQVGALSRAETGSQAFGNIASGLGSLVKIPIPFGK